jgi:hypothetical protein
LLRITEREYPLEKKTLKEKEDHMGRLIFWYMGYIQFAVHSPHAK